ncbi:S-adenosylmethionine mitochondrial carrier protein isoform X2 [Prunus persica]|uniref:S-adenosylmethionine mitochondrial carrier protein isoform X2 n=1 Tax=Prunus persica TaxID=3760 RepID=UPI0009AB7A82|nr:S-adenosylmethionine mitochondrial carrier protein isoform X2 [Prunus persica]
MAGCNKRHKNDQPSIKYRWYPVGQASSGLADFVHEKYPPFVSDKINKQRSRKPEPKSPAILSNAMLISAVGQIWDCASRPLGFFQPKAHSNHNDSGCQKEVVLADLGREGNDVAPISAKSALSGIVVSVCLHPVDTIKTVVQSCRAEQKSLCYIGKSIVSDRGLTGLYRGIATNIASSAPISAVYTFTYESVKGALLPLFPKEYYSFAHCMAGGCASIATSFIFTPSERIKQQMQVGSHYNNCWNALVGIVRNGGLPSLYAGWGAVLCRNVPHSIVKFYTYESLKQFMLSPNEASVHPTTLQTLVCGGLAGSTAALLTTPFDVVKTRLQTQIPGSMSQYNSVIHALQEIGKNEGLKGLYRGLTPRLVMYMSQGALFFASYEFFKSLFSLDTPQTDAPRIQYQQKTEGNPVLPSSLPAMSSPASSELRGLHS